MKLTLRNFLRLVVSGAAGAALVQSAHAMTLLTGDPTTETNAPIPIDYGSNAVGTPNVTLAWDAPGTGSGNSIVRWESYKAWNGRGEVYQMNEAQAGTYYSVNFTPDAGFNVLLRGTDIDIWEGGGNFVINWEVTGATSGSLGSGQATISSTGLNPIDFGALQGIGSEMVTLKLIMDATSTGIRSYLALDNLAFDQVDGLDVPPAVAPSQPNYAEGADITVNFSGGQGNASDWIGIYRGSQPPPAAGNSAIVWTYVNGTSTPSGSTTTGSLTFANPGLAPGIYKIWFLANDGYDVQAGPATFNIISTAEPQPLKWVVSPFRLRHATVGTAYTGKISAYASGPDGSSLTFTKSAGPAWLTIGSGGAVSGTPGTGDVGINTFTLTVDDVGDTADATLTLEVFAIGAEEEVRLKVLSYNLWHGWGQINGGHRKGIETIILSDADIIGTQETVDNVSGGGVYQVQKIASDLGWFYSPTGAGDSGIASRYPITETLTAGGAKGARVRIATNPLREVIVYNCHLDYVNYGPYAAQLSGATAASVLSEELKSQRDEEIAAILSAMSGNLANSEAVPVLLTGDFNAPSHLDWTPATAASHGGVSGVAWPASTAVQNAGLSDSFRVIHPDPALEPGITWSPLFIGDPLDRIDFIYHKGDSLQPIASEVFHTPVEVTLGAWGASTASAKNNTWPSDHAAVLTTFHLDPIDSDDDGLSDAFEMRYFGNLTAQNGGGDADQDGQSNFIEQSSGTSPVAREENSPLSLEIPAENTDPIVLRFGVAPVAFVTGWVCERTNDFNAWTTVWSYRADPMLQSPLLDLDGTEDQNWQVMLTDPWVDRDSFPRCFYRLRSGE